MTSQSQTASQWKKRVAACVAGGLLLCGASAVAQEAVVDAVTTDASKEVTIPFAPPLDQPLRYEVVNSKQRAGQQRSASMLQELRFRREGEGYILTVTLVRGSLPGLPELGVEAGGKGMPAAIEPLLRPIDYDVGADGSVIRMRGWDELKKALGPALDATLAAMESDPAKQEQAKAVVGKIGAAMQGMSAEQAGQTFLKPWSAFLGLGRNAREPGEWYEAKLDIDTGIFPIPLPATSRTRLTRTSSTIFGWEQHVVIDAEAAGKAMTGYLETLLRASGKPDADKAVAAMREALGDMTIKDHMEASIDASTGLVTEAAYSREVSAAGQTGGDSSRVKRVD